MTHSLLRDKNLIRFGATRAQADMEDIWRQSVAKLARSR